MIKLLRLFINSQRWRKKFFAFLCFGLILSAVNAASGVWAEEEIKTVRVGVYDNKPKVYRDDKGEVSGLFPDILNYIAKQENWHLDYIFGTWEEGLTRLERGEIDLMVDVAITEERQERFDFTNETVFNSWGVIYVAENSAIETWRDLDGKRIAILKSSVYYGGPEGVDAYIRAFGVRADFVTVDEYQEVFDLLNQGEVDAAVVSRVFGLANQEDYPKIKEAEMFFSPTELRFALTKADSDNQYLIEKLDYWVRKLKEGHDDVYHQILRSCGLEGEIVSQEVIPQWVIPAASAGVVVLVLLLLITIRLIRKRVISIQKLRESEEKFSKAFQTSPYAITITKVKDGSFIEVNDAFVALTGFSRKEAMASSSVGMKLWVNEKDRQQVVADLGAGKAVRGREYLFRIKNGEIRIGSFYAQIIQLGNETCILSSIADITDWKKTEKIVKARTKELENLAKHQEETKKALLNVMADLKELSARNEAILDSMADGVIVVDKNGVIILMNHSAEKLLGWEMEESVGKKWYEVIKRQDETGQPILPEKGAIRKALVDKVTTLPSVATSIYYYRRKDGTSFPVARAVSPIILGEKVAGAVSVFRNISGEKELEEMKDSFMDIAAHDLRTPAAAIRGFISRVLDGDAGEITDKARELLKGAYEGNLHMVNLVDDFLMVSRLERGKIKIKPREGKLEAIIEEAVAGLLSSAKLKGLSLEYQKIELPAVLMDEERIIQVLNNLITNAIKFTEKGGITIRHEIGKGEVITQVTDTGIGISPEAQKRLFQKYYKGDQGKSRAGLGLGLYISRLCVEGMGGKIWVKSQEGKGSFFSFSLPIAKQG